MGSARSSSLRHSESCWRRQRLASNPKWRILTRQGQILKLIATETISSQDELRRRLSALKLRVTQATLSRDISELRLVKSLLEQADELSPEQPA